jgi:hypothetical protein
MQKKIIMACLAFVMVGAASAQKEATPPKPPKAPKPPVEKLKEIPPPPPPAPPDAPPPPPAPPVIPVEELNLLPDDYQAFLSRNPSVGSLRWNKEAVWVMLKDGKEERYLLNEAGIKEAEAKYGQLPVAPPPPPPLPPPPPTKRLKRTLS